MRLPFGATATQVKNVSTNARPSATGASQWATCRRRVRRSHGSPAAIVRDESVGDGSDFTSLAGPVPLVALTARMGAGIGRGTTGSGAASIAAPVSAGGV